MKVSEYIAFTIDRLSKGYVFTYADFTTEVNKKEAVIKALNRMVTSGKIAKLSKGKYYKPENTPFGNLLPNQAQVVKDLLEENGKNNGLPHRLQHLQPIGLNHTGKQYYTDRQKSGSP